MSKKKLINTRELAAVLRESVVSLVKPGPMRLMAEIGDHRYYRQRALELINLTLMASTPAQQTHYLAQAITLLGIAKHVIQQENVIESPGDVVHVKIFEEPEPNQHTLEESMEAIEAGKTTPIEELTRKDVFEELTRKNYSGWADDVISDNPCPLPGPEE